MIKTATITLRNAGRFKHVTDLIVAI